MVLSVIAGNNSKIWVQMSFSEELAAKIKNRSARVGVVGLGYVGLPVAVEFAGAGFTAIGFDVNRSRIKALRFGRSHIPDVASSQVQALIKHGQLKVTDQEKALGSCDAIVICVPTPLRKSKDPDMSFILQSAQGVGRHLRRGQLVILESTTYPGTTRELVLPCLARKGLEVGRDFFLAFSPERIDPGNKNFTVTNTPKVVGGITANCARLAAQLYQTLVSRIIQVSSSESAEMVKLLENTFRAVNIGLVNEVALMCHRLRLDV
ncbi:MAG: nucleotide sugar dehydrogenase [Elusimicrobiota bacterium]